MLTMTTLHSGFSSGKYVIYVMFYIYIIYKAIKQVLSQGWFLEHILGASKLHQLDDCFCIGQTFACFSLSIESM